MRKVVHTFMAALLVAPLPAVAKYADPGHGIKAASACIAFDQSYAETISLCQQAMDDGAWTRQQYLELLAPLARAHYYLDHDEKAQALYREMLELDPGFVPALVGLGWGAYDIKDYEAAGRFFETALSRSPSAEIYAGLGASLYLGGQAKVDQAIELIDQALAMQPEYSWALRRKGWMLEDHNRLSEAEEAFRRAVELTPANAAANFALSHVLRRQRNWREALVFVNRALELNPGYVRALSGRALILYYMDHPGPALKDADAVIAARPNWAEGYVRKARVLIKLDRAEEAHVLLGEIDGRLGYNGFLTYWRARLLLDDGQPDRALEQSSRILSEGSPDLYDYLLQARIGLALYNRDVARPAVDEALSLQPGNKWVLYYDAMTLVQEHRFPDAVSRFDAAVAAGLSKRKLDEFVAALEKQKDHARAQKMRERYAMDSQARAAE
ncbi:tetratricopeptide repeat protein [Phaeobacter sp. 22II1-1F12B]|uniref:tetratricopeptide repeat protein n=1 Tax=Phaeobacter sp. 22II1-1F12B TaxID=1317111 RepID=UPI000B51F3EA|nr:tetratricopeptide repeat protein [Phaeobacter sp. 22II1-1F12B]